MIKHKVTKDIAKKFRYDPETGHIYRLTGRFAGRRADKPDTLGYMVIWVGGRTPIRSHRIAWWFISGGENPISIDHVNGDRSDNRAINLRAATSSQQQGNRSRRKNNKGYKCVRKTREGRFAAYIGEQGTMRHLGHFDTPEDAAKAYDIAAIKKFGVFAKLNFPKGVS